MGDEELWRDAAQEDFEFLYSVLVATRWPGKVYNEAQERERYTKKFNLEGLHVIRHEGQDVGRLRLVLGDDGRMNILNIAGLQILPAFQRRGIGSKILSQVIYDAPGMSADVTLEVKKDNEGAQRLYRAKGFVHIGPDPNCEDAIRMRYFTHKTLPGPGH